ncbi:MAG: hypothetical protein IKU07_00525 [Oscillospiraceae bacterium]|nr:hypothetical protein [Oscillospiraceae bacterium]
MRTALIIRKLVTASIALLILLYFVQKTTSPKIIFAPFLICSLASIGKNLGLLFNREKIAKFFDWLFKVIFFLAWFAFLIVACYIAVRDGNYQIILFSLPFWAGGLFFAKRKLFNKKENA